MRKCIDYLLKEKLKVTELRTIDSNNNNSNSNWTFIALNLSIQEDSKVQ